MLPLVYMQTADPEFPGSVAYPKDEMVARFGSQFFTNSIAWMLALAITRSPPAIGVWGVEGSTHDEYHQERPGTLHFIELARALGIEVIIPEGCKLLQPGVLYGYETNLQVAVAA